jgi:hypothetical protein
LVQQKESYKGKEIIIDTPNAHGHEGHEHHIHLSIDKRDIHVMQLSSGKYSTHYLPYEKFPSILTLAKALIDKVPLFSEGIRK